MGNTGITWELLEMQNLGSLTPYLLQSVLWFCSLCPLPSLKLSILNGSGSSSSTAPSLLGVQFTAGTPGHWGVLEVGLETENPLHRPLWYWI